VEWDKTDLDDDLDVPEKVTFLRGILCQQKLSII
jgi:hypothetical protein